MASVALEEKIHKIRLRNEEIKRRYEEVEADKKNAAELDALAAPIPIDDWPMRKEPPEFSAPVAKHSNKPKISIRKHNDQSAQFYTGSGEGKKTHTFADGQGPPPDPKYNFLADSEREERADEIPKESERNRGRNKPSREVFKRRGSGRDWHAAEHWSQHENSGNLTHAEYEAWRAERNRIDEARISRQRTAEGNWRREWDNDKMHLADDITKRENRVTLGEIVTRQEHSENDKYYRSPRVMKYPYQSNTRESHEASNFSEAMKNPGSLADNEKRVVIAADKSIKVLLNAQASTQSRSSVMSVKVSSLSIAGTGRVGPRQRPRVMYSSQSETDSSNNEFSYPARQKSVDETTKVRNFEQTQRNSLPKSPHHQRKNEAKGIYAARKDHGEGRSWKKNGERDEETSRSFRKDSQKFSQTQKPTTPLNRSKFSRGYRKSGESTTADDQSNDFLGQTAQKSNDNDCANYQLQGDTESMDDCEKRGIAVSILPRLETNMTSTPGDSVGLFKTFSSADPGFGGIAPMPSGSEKNLSSFERREQSYETSPDDLAVNENQEKIDFPNDNDETKLNNAPNKIEALDDRAINCSVNSDTTNDDSGFIESSSDRSIHNVSDNHSAENSEIDGKSLELENHRIAETRAIQSTPMIDKKIDVAPASNDSGADNVQSEIPDEAEKSLVSGVKNHEDGGSIESDAQREKSVDIETSIETQEIVEKSIEPSTEEVPNVLPNAKVDGEITENSIDEVSEDINEIQEKSG